MKHKFFKATSPTETFESELRQQVVEMYEASQTKWWKSLLLVPTFAALALVVLVTSKLQFEPTQTPRPSDTPQSVTPQPNQSQKAEIIQTQAEIETFESELTQLEEVLIIDNDLESAITFEEI